MTFKFETQAIVFYYSKGSRKKFFFLVVGPLRGRVRGGVKAGPLRKKDFFEA